MKPCPNCGQNVRDEYKLCPFCGTDRETGEQPPLIGRRDDAFALENGLCVGGALLLLVYYLCGAMYVESGNLLVAAQHGHKNWGSPAQIMAQRTEYLWLGFGLPVLMTGLPHLLLSRRFPSFARGLGYICLMALAIALGAPFLCSQ